MEDRAWIAKRAVALDLFQHGLAAVAPGPAVARALAQHPAASEGRVRVVALGKAAVGMYAGASAALGERIERALIATPAAPSQDGAALGARLIIGGHPIPDEGSLAAGAELMDLVAGWDGPLLLLLSGGASACVEVPLPGVDLAILREVNRRLLSEELDIAAVNAVRSAYSRIKGGGLLRLVSAERTWALAISDVPGDDPSVIGSGLLHPSPGQRARVESLTAALGLPRPPRAPVPTTTLPQDHSQLILSAVDALQAMAARARALALSVEVGERPIVGPVAAAGLAFADRTAGADAIQLAAGECAMRLPAHPGRGGRCQQLALTAAKRLAGSDHVLLAAGSDGDDGPYGAAGALVDGGTWQRILDAGLDPANALSRADAGTALEAAGDLLDTGTTGTNVGDLFIGIPADCD